MDTARIAAWLMNGKDVQDSSPRTAQQPLLRRPKQPACLAGSGYPDRDWTNPNRFSDPLNQASRLPHSAAFTLPARPNKAYTWYLDKHLPWTRAQARSKTILHDREHQSKSRTGWEDGGLSRSKSGWGDGDHSLFSHTGSKSDAREGKVTTETGPCHVSHTWERVGQHGQNLSRERTTGLRSHTLGPGPPVSHTGRLSPLAFGTVSSSTTRNTRSHFGGASAYVSACSRARDSPCSSQRSSPSPQGTVNRLSPGVLQRLHAPPSRLSPTPHLPSRTSPYSSSHSNSSNSPCLSRRAGNSLILSRQSSPFSSQASSNGDISFGSETDDDFFYVSCQQLAQGLAHLSVTPSPASCQGKQDGPVLHNSPLPSPGNGDFTEEDFDFGGFSDDALSDDVFLDNPQPTTSAAENAGFDISVEELSQRNSETNRCREVLTDDNKDGNEGDAAGIESHPAVESLRRNSLQSKMRQTWRHRRHKGTAGNRDSLACRGTQDAADGSDKSAAQHSPSSQHPHREGESTSEKPEEKPGYYYVISPTDDADMPDVIAVRKSSVELIRWQNSLRRRRRRQAKRHDLGRVTKREAKVSATV